MDTDPPWLSQLPTSGTVAAATDQQIVLDNNTPTAVSLQHIQATNGNTAVLPLLLVWAMLLLVTGNRRRLPKESDHNLLTDCYQSGVRVPHSGRRDKKSRLHHNRIPDTQT